MAHSTLRCCFSSFMFACISLFKALLMSCHSSWIEVRTLTGPLQPHNSLLFQSFPDVLGNHCPVAWLSFSQALGVGQITLAYSGIQRSSCSTQCLQGAQVLCLLISPNSHFSTTLCDSWYEVFLLICCVF